MNYSTKNQIKLFWKYSENGQLDRFNFDEFFYRFTIKIYKKLASHAQLGIDDYIEYQKKHYNLNKLKYFAYKSSHTGFSESHKDILRNVFLQRFLHFKKYFKSNKNFINLGKIYKLLNKKNMLQTEKVLLVDRCIHAQHNSNYILNINIDKLRKQSELIK